MAQLSAAKTELSQKQTELNAAKEQLSVKETELNAAKEQLSAAREELESKKKKPLQDAHSMKRRKQRTRSRKPVRNSKGSVSPAWRPAFRRGSCADRSGRADRGDYGSA